MPKNICLLLLMLSIHLSSFAQHKGDSRIIITVSDTANLYQKVKTAFVRSNFIVKDLPTLDTVSTYPREFNNLYTIAFAIIHGNKITLNGRYSLKQVSYFGYNNPSKDSKRIIYYKGSKTWELLMRVASLIGTEIEYLD